MAREEKPGRTVDMAEVWDEVVPFEEDVVVDHGDEDGGCRLEPVPKISGSRADLLPRTSRSKASAPTSPPLPDEVAAFPEPTLIKSSDFELLKLFVFEDSSRSFFVCSCSIFVDNDLMRLMNSWNCWRLSNGPRLNVHKAGSTSIARKSVSAILPTCLKTASAAIIAPGSLVLIPFNSGTILS